MLRVSKLADYGTVVMVCLARSGPELMSARDIAEKTHLALPTVSKILKALATADLLTSVRGVSGGYRLKHSAADISVAQIVYALDESRGLTECSFHQSACSLQGVCQIQGNWRAISQAVEAALESVSLATLAKPALSEVTVSEVKRIASGVRKSVQERD